jgi:hypothetical protein
VTGTIYVGCHPYPDHAVQTPISIEHTASRKLLVAGAWGGALVTSRKGIGILFHMMGKLNIDVSVHQVKDGFPRRRLKYLDFIKEYV